MQIKVLNQWRNVLKVEYSYYLPPKLNNWTNRKFQRHLVLTPTTKAITTSHLTTKIIRKKFARYDYICVLKPALFEASLCCIVLSLHTFSTLVTNTFFLVFYTPFSKNNHRCTLDFSFCWFFVTVLNCGRMKNFNLKCRCVFVYCCCH